MAVATDAAAQAQEAQTDQLRNQLLTALVALYGIGMAADMLTDPVQFAAFLGRLVPFSLAVQASMVRATVQDLARQLPLDEPILVKPTTIIGAHLRNGVPMEQVYARAVWSVEDRLDAGYSFTEAVDYGQHRLLQTAATDLQLARTHTAQRYTSELQTKIPHEIVGSRRTLSSKPQHCALCILASTRTYKAHELMDIHPGCGCGVALIIGDEQPPPVNEQFVLDLPNIIRRDLGDAYASSGGRGLEDYKNIIVTHEHGELGPVLGVRNQHFEGPEHVARLDEHQPIQPHLPA